MIRIAEKKDVPGILAVYAPYILNSTATFEYDVPTEEAFMQRFEGVTAQFPWLVWEEAGEILGYAYAGAPYERAAFGWCAEPAVYLMPRAQGRGIGGKLYAALEKILAYQGYQVLYALVTDENELSVRFHERLGYERRAHFPGCGFKFGRWLGLYWMEKRLKTVEIPSNWPTSWASIVQDYKNRNDILDVLSLS